MSIETVLVALGVAAGYLIGRYYGGRPKTSFHIPSTTKDSPQVFDENTYFVEPRDVLESYKQSSTVTEFIKKIK